MSRAQIKKLETILAKLEALQNQVASNDIRDRLGYGKNELIRALGMADKDSQS